MIQGNIQIVFEHIFRCKIYQLLQKFILLSVYRVVYTFTCCMHVILYSQLFYLHPLLAQFIKDKSCIIHRSFNLNFCISCSSGITEYMAHFPC